MHFVLTVSCIKLIAIDNIASPMTKYRQAIANWAFPSSESEPKTASPGTKSPKPIVDRVMKEK